MKLATVIIALSVLCGAMSCQARALTDEEAQVVRTTTGVAGTVFGLPPIVGDTIGGAIVAAIAAFAGHKHGRRTEKKAKANG